MEIECEKYVLFALRQHKKTRFILWNINTPIKSANMSLFFTVISLSHTHTHHNIPPHSETTPAGNM